MNPDLLAAMTPDTLNAVQQVSQLLAARRKNKPGPGGMAFSLPSLRRMNTKRASEMDGITQLMAAITGQQQGGMPQGGMGMPGMPPAPGMPAPQQGGMPADLSQFMGMLQ